MWIAVALAGACTELPQVPSNVCGNGVVEQGEDCDLYVQAPQVCHAPGTFGACRLACSQKGGSAGQCPAGWSCGVDGICREPSGRFTESQAPVAAGVRRVVVADFDGDGRQDVLGTGNASEAALALPRFFFSSASGQLQDSAAFGLPIASPSVADLSADGRKDVAFSTPFGLGVLVGRMDRTVASVTYPILSLPEGQRIQLLRVLGFSGSPNREGVLMAIGAAGETGLGSVDEQQLLLTLPYELNTLVDGPTAADVIAGPLSPCEEVLLAFAGNSDVLMVEPCDTQGAWKTSATAEPIASLPGGAVLDRGVRLADLDGDGLLDMIASAAPDITHVAFGCGTGSFCAWPGDQGPKSLRQLVPLDVVIDATCETGELADLRFPLAIGDLDGDGRADVITPREVRTTQELEFDKGAGRVVMHACQIARKLAGEWSIARIVDVNHDGRLDVLAGSSSSLDVELMIGTGKERLNPAIIPTQGPVGALTTGDFDGDLVTDVAIGESSGDMSEDGQDRLSIAFGRSFGIPEPPIEVARFTSIRQLVGARYERSDAIEELGVVADEGNLQSISVLYGQTGRKPFTPFGLELIDDPATQGPEGADVPIASVTGQFTADDHPDIAAIGVHELCDVSDCAARLWLLPSTGAARLTASKPSAYLPPEMRMITVAPGAPGPALLVFPVALDLDDDGIDELVLLSSRGKQGTGAWSARPDTAGTGWQNTDAPLTLVGSTSLSLAVESNPLVADLDGDGHKDLVLILVGTDTAKKVAIAWNDGAGGLTLAEPTVLSMGKEEPSAFGLLTADAAGARLVVATDTGLYVASTSAGARRSLSMTRVAEVSGARSVAGGDVTGDGVEDLVVAVEGGIRVFHGEPVLP